MDSITPMALSELWNAAIIGIDIAFSILVQDWQGSAKDNQR
jgi:hypothetical protein